MPSGRRRAAGQALDGLVEFLLAAEFDDLVVTVEGVDVQTVPVGAEARDRDEELEVLDPPLSEKTDAHLLGPHLVVAEHEARSAVSRLDDGIDPGAPEEIVHSGVGPASEAEVAFVGGLSCGVVVGVERAVHEEEVLAAVVANLDPDRLDPLLRKVHAEELPRLPVRGHGDGDGHREPAALLADRALLEGHLLHRTRIEARATRQSDKGREHQNSVEHMRGGRSTHASILPPSARRAKALRRGEYRRPE